MCLQSLPNEEMIKFAYGINIRFSLITSNVQVGSASERGKYKDQVTYKNHSPRTTHYHPSRIIRYPSKLHMFVVKKCQVSSLVKDPKSRIFSLLLDCKSKCFKLRDTIRIFHLYQIMYKPFHYTSNKTSIIKKRSSL